MIPALNGTIVVYVRAILSALTLILTIATIVPGYISMSEFQGKYVYFTSYTYIYFIKYNLYFVKYNFY